MEKISQAQINTAIQVLEEKGLKADAEALRQAEIIPALYVLTYLQRVHNELKEIKTKEELDDLNDQIPKLELYSIIFPKTKLDAVKSIIEKALERKKLICDFDDTKHPHTKQGLCENVDHSGDKEIEELHLLLDDDEDAQKFIDEMPTYWCQDCVDSTDFEGSVSCDMEVD